MARYVYGCNDPTHPRWELEHSMKIETLGVCHLCGEKLHRIPQPFLFGFSPIEILRDWSEGNWSKKLRGEPRDYQNVSNPYRGIPQKDYGARSKGAVDLQPPCSVMARSP